MEIKRILVVTTTDFGFNGITSVIMNYYRNINRNKIQFDFAIGESIHKDLETEIEYLGGHIFKLPSRKMKLIQYIRALKALVKEKSYKIVHVHGNSGTLYLDIHALKQARVPIRIAHSHNSTCSHKIIHKILKKSLNKETTIAIACSKLAGDWLFNKEYIILNNGIDIEKFAFNSEVRNKYRKEMNLDGKYVLGHIGHFSYQKNHEYLLKTFKEVHDRESNAILMLIGDGKLKQEIENQIKDLGIKDSVLLLGKRSDAAQLMQAMDVFVFPSRFEGLPVVLVEAQTAGLKCIVSDTITKECQITGRLKYLNLNESIDMWVTEVAKCKKSYKRDGIETFIRNSKYNIKNEIKKLEEIYLEA